MTFQLRAHRSIRRPSGPVCLIVLDGVGLGPPDEGNAWHLARTPYLDTIFAGQVYGALQAHGTAVGMPSDGDMGNSEVGHNALGAGRVFDQGASLVQNAVADGSIFESDTWRWLRGDGPTTLHLIGLWSDGNVHSHVDHAYALVERARQDGFGAVRVHVLLDGRDVGETSALEYLEPLEAKLAQLRDAGFDARVASGGGRMVTTMDRYEADWSVVQRGWQAHVLGEGRRFPSASVAVQTLRDEDAKNVDQYLPEFVVTDGRGAPAGPIQDGDAVVFFNFRGDRALEITQAFEAAEGGFDAFDRVRVPAVRYAGMMQYDGDLQLPSRYLVAPPAIDRTLGEYLARNGQKQLAISETQKFGHVTYFMNGNNSQKFDEELERWVEIPSDVCDFAERPWMKAADITDRALAEIDSYVPDLVRMNYANGDMVGHTGSLQSAIIAMECLDLCVSRFMRGVLARGGLCVVTADHGNADEMFTRDKKRGGFAMDANGVPKPLTSHTLNPVPFTVVGPGAGEAFRWNGALDKPGIANVTATVLNLLGYEAPADYLPSLVID